MSARWWSDSKKTWQPISSLPDGHIHNALKKLEEGRYAPPAGALTAQETADLDAALRGEIARREAAKYPDAIPDDEVDMSGGAS